MDTPFPFPWGQAVTITLLIFVLTAPFLIAAFTTSILLSSSMTFLVTHTYIMLNEVARDIEDPFHYDPNELPLPQIQYRLNERLLAVSRTGRPVAFTDVADLAGPGNVPAMPSQAGTPVRLQTLVLLCALVWSLRVCRVHGRCGPCRPWHRSCDAVASRHARAPPHTRSALCFSLVAGGAFLLDWLTIEIEDESSRWTRAERGGQQD